MIWHLVYFSGEILRKGQAKKVMMNFSQYYQPVLGSPFYDFSRLMLSIFTLKVWANVINRKISLITLKVHWIADHSFDNLFQFQTAQELFFNHCTTFCFLCCKKKKIFRSISLQWTVFKLEEDVLQSKNKWEICYFPELVCIAGYQFWICCLQKMTSKISP